MTAPVRALIVGIDPQLFAASPAAPDFPQVDPAVVDDSLQANGRELATKFGIETQICYIDYGATAASVFGAALTENRPDFVIVGGGIRLPPAQTHLLEVIVDCARRLVPQAQILFNTSPDSTAAAVERWYPHARPLSVTAYQHSRP